MSEAIVKIVFFGCLCIWCFIILRHSKWFPWYLGGKIGSFDGMNEGMPFVEVPPQAGLCILLFLSLYTYQMLELLVNGLERPDFNETFAHHICAVSLTFGAIFANGRGLGLIISYLHAVTDIFVNFSRIFASIKYNGPILISYLVMMVLWIWFRIFVFGYIIYRVWGRELPG